VKAELFEIPCQGTGPLSTMVRRRGGEWLSDEITALRREGVDVLVSSLELSEAAELGLLGERVAAEREGITFIEAPMPDRQLPRRSEFLTLRGLSHSRPEPAPGDTSAMQPWRVHRSERSPFRG